MKCVWQLRRRVQQTGERRLRYGIPASSRKVGNMKNRCSYLVLAMFAFPVSAGCGEEKEIIFCDAVRGACPAGGAGGAAGSGGTSSGLGGAGGVQMGVGGDSGNGGAAPGGNGGGGGQGGSGGAAGGPVEVPDAGLDAGGSGDSGLDGGPVSP